MRLLTLLILLTLPLSAAAEIFVCVDPATGEKSFTDKACGSHGTGDEVRVKKGNFGDSGGTRDKNTGARVWRSDDRSDMSTSADYSGPRRNIESAKNAGTSNRPGGNS